MYELLHNGQLNPLSLTELSLVNSQRQRYGLAGVFALGR